MKSTTFDKARCLELREARGLTQAHLAAKIGKLLGRPVSPATISNLERGKRQPSPPFYLALCRALDVRPDELRMVSSDQAA